MAGSMFETHIAGINRQVVSTREGEVEKVTVEVTALGQKLGSSFSGIRVLRELISLEHGIMPFDVVMTLISPSIEEIVRQGNISSAEATSIFAIAADSARRRAEREGRQELDF